MVELLSMPSKVLLKIFMFLPDQQSHKNLAVTHLRLSHLRSQYRATLQLSLLIHRSPAFDYAFKFALASATKSTKQPSAIWTHPNEWVELVKPVEALRERTMSACLKYYRKNFGKSRLEPALLVRGYYITKMLVLAHDYPEFKESIFTALENASSDEVSNYSRIYEYMLGGMRKYLCKSDVDQHSLESTFCVLRGDQLITHSYTNTAWIYARDVLRLYDKDSLQGLYTNEKPIDLHVFSQSVAELRERYPDVVKRMLAYEAQLERTAESQWCIDMWDMGNEVH